MDVLALTLEEVRAFDGEELLDWCREAVLVVNRVAAVQTLLWNRVEARSEGAVLCGPT